MLIKLLIHPILTGLTSSAAIAAGSPLGRFGADNGHGARIILLSTVLAFCSFSAAAAWLV